MSGLNQDPPTWQRRAFGPLLLRFDRMGPGGQARTGADTWQLSRPSPTTKLILR